MNEFLSRFSSCWCCASLFFSASREGLLIAIEASAETEYRYFFWFCWFGNSSTSSYSSSDSCSSWKPEMFSSSSSLSRVSSNYFILFCRNATFCLSSIVSFASVSESLLTILVLQKSMINSMWSLGLFFRQAESISLKSGWILFIYSVNSF